MAQNGFSEPSRRILSAAQLHAEKSLRQIAQQTRLPTHTVQYWINRLVEQDIIRRGVVVNPVRIGESRYGFFFSIDPRGLKHKAKLLKFLSSHERVIWYAELGAEFQFGATLIARSGIEIQDFLIDLEKKAGMTLIRKAINLLNDFTMLEKSYLYGNRNLASREKLLVGAAQSVIEVDAIDRKILSVINEFSSHLEITRKTGIARQTVDSRVQKLRAQGVILRDVFYINASRLGYHVFRILVTLLNQQALVWSKFCSICEAQPHVVNYTRCVGSWDGEVVVEAQDSAQVAQIVSDLAAKLDGDILDIRIVPILGQRTSTRTLGTDLSAIT